MPKHVRVKIPTNKSAQIALLGTVSDKNTDLAADSPIKGLKWSVIGPALASAAEHDKNASDLEKQMEKEYRDRDINMPTVNQALRDARDILLGTYSTNPKTLGDFGFVVDDTPKAKKPPATP